MAMAAASLMVLLFVLPAVFGTNYPVTWDTSSDYSQWQSGKTLNVGDTLTFTYVGSHSLDVVDKSGYDGCSSGNAIESHNDGNTVITLKKSGPLYFICPTPGHCGNGMKLAVTVAAGSPTTPSGSTPTPTTPSTSPTTPGTSPPTGTTTPSTPKTPSGAASSSYNMNFMVVGASLVMASLFALMG